MENVNSAEQMGALSPQALRNMSADQFGGIAPEVISGMTAKQMSEMLPNMAGITEGDGVWNSSATSENSSLEGVTPMETNVTSVDIEKDVDLVVSGIIPAENQSLDSNFDSALALMDSVTAKNIAGSIDTAKTDTADTPIEDTSNEDII